MLKPSSLIRNTARTLDQFIGAMVTAFFILLLIGAGYNLANTPIISALLDHVLLLPQLREEKNIWSQAQQAADLLQNLQK